MRKYQEITEARKWLELPEKATMGEIKSSYRRLIARWHPDRGHGDKEKCNEMTQKIIKSYKIINNYCKEYKYSFSREEVQNYLSGEEWWVERFGDGALWGGNGKPE